jgi:hypothetical protein
MYLLIPSTKVDKVLTVHPRLPTHIFQLCQLIFSQSLEAKQLLYYFKITIFKAIKSLYPLLS